MSEGCDHKLSQNRHAFVWPENLPEDHPKAFTGRDRFLVRNIWNPLDPVCTKCGKHIGELFGIFTVCKEKANE